MLSASLGAIPQVLFKEITEHMPAKIFVFFVTVDCQGIVKRRGAESAEEVFPKELCVLCDSAFQTSTRILNSHTEPRSQEQRVQLLRYLSSSDNTYLPVLLAAS